ncbi:MAG: hypothetical protein OQL06_10005 [Gammaproteobacteria bacterium]|nr:hypothetical protein [Gammaproteobacteria bacterium]
MHNFRTFFLIFLLTFTTAANAVAPVVITAATVLANLVGSSAIYFAVEDAMQNEEGSWIDVIFVADDDAVTDAEINAAYEDYQVPAHPEPFIRWPIAYTIPENTYNTSGAPHTITAGTPVDFLQAMAYLPSDVAQYMTAENNYKGNVSALFLAENIANFEYVEPYKISTNFYARFVWSSGAHLVPVSVDCPAGYILNNATAVCDVVDLDAARAADEPDTCIVRQGVVDVVSEACIMLEDAGILAHSTNPETGETAVTAVADNSAIFTMSESQAGDRTISVTKSIPEDLGGGHTREDSFIDENGTIGPAVTTFYPAAPPPLFPGDTGSTIPSSAFPNPGDSGTSVAVDTGGIETRLDTVNNSISDLTTTLTAEGDTPTDASEGDVTAAGGELTGQYDALKNRLDFSGASFSLGTAGCPPISLHFDIFGTPFDYESMAMCELIEGSGTTAGIRPILEPVLLLMWLLLAIRIVLEA